MKWDILPEHPKRDSYDPCSKQDLHSTLYSIIELQNNNVITSMIVVEVLPNLRSRLEENQL